MNILSNKKCSMDNLLDWNKAIDDKLLPQGKRRLFLRDLQIIEDEIDGKRTKLVRILAEDGVYHDIWEFCNDSYIRIPKDSAITEFQQISENGVNISSAEYEIAACSRSQMQELSHVATEILRSKKTVSIETILKNAKVKTIICRPKRGKVLKSA